MLVEPGLQGGESIAGEGARDLMRGWAHEGLLREATASGLERIRGWPGRRTVSVAPEVVRTHPDHYVPNGSVDVRPAEDRRHGSR